MMGPDPTTLYHYTDASGLHGIVTSNRLRFGDARVLNDQTEFVHGLTVAREVVEEALLQTDNEPVLLRAQHYLSPEMVYRRLYVFSLSETEESISQWQRYGADGYGYCLGFELRSLATLFEPRVKLRKIIYDHDEQYAVLQSALADALAAVRADIDERGRSTDIGGAVLAVTLEEIALQFKNSSFEDEREWRLIVDVDADNQDQFTVQHLPRGPYVKPFTDVGPADLQAKIPLISVTYGPKLNSELATVGTTAFLASWKLPDVAVRQSRLARTWR